MKFQVTDKKLILIDRSMKLVGDNEYEFEFEFDEEWEGKIKTARFLLGDNRQDVILVDDKCAINKGFFKGGRLTVGVYASNLATEPIKRRVLASILDGDAGDPIVPEEVWTQLTKLIEADVQYIGETKVDFDRSVEDTKLYFDELKGTLDNMGAEVTKLKTSAEQAVEGVETAIEDTRNATQETLTAKTAIEGIAKSVTQSEFQRVEAEGKRVTSEENRINAENLRVKAESSRAKAESDRNGAEQERVTAETARANNEKFRNNAESSRKSAEQARAEAETSRENAESSRAKAEQSRVNSESERVTAEQNRANAESLRVEAESSREAAEKNRVEAESERARFYDGFSEQIESVKSNLGGIRLNVKEDGKLSISYVKKEA